MIHFTADLHLGHYNIIKYCHRPFKTAEEMNDAIQERWNKVVDPNDTVMVLGDVAFKNASLELMKNFNGIKWLIRGNHDRGFSATKFKNAGFEMIINKPYHFIHLEEGHPIFINCCHAPLPANFRKGMINLCGHVHDAWYAKYGFLNVGMDQWAFEPISYLQVLESYQKRYPELTLRRTLSSDFHQLI